MGSGADTRLFPPTKRRVKSTVPIGGAYRLIDVPMSNCINSGINEVYILTQYNSALLNRHLARAYNFGSGVTCGGGYVEEADKTGLPVWMLGFGAERLRADMNRLLALLFHQGVLDEQFLQLQQLQDESSPNFVSEVVNIYFHESEKLLRNLRGLLLEREFSDYKKVGSHLNQFMGSSSSIGAKRVRNVCVAFRAASEQSNRAACLRALELLEYEYCYLKNKLHELFQIEQQRILAAAVRYPPVQHPINNP